MNTKITKGFDIESHSGDPIELTDDNDKYSYNNFVKAIANTIMTCATPLVIGIYGRWGTGKSTILKTIKKILTDNKTSQFYIYDFTPWQYILNDFEDVWTAFITEIEYQKNPLGKKLSEVLNKAKAVNIAKKIGKVAFGYLSGGADTVLEETGTYDLIMEVKEAFEKGVKDCVGSDDKNRVIIVIDDLDRCENKISIEVLKVIQLVCRTKGCVFILGMDREVINDNLEKHYKNKVFAAEYLDKMIQIHIMIPDIKHKYIKKVILHNSKNEKRQYFNLLSNKVFKTLIELLDSNPRKIERFLSLYDFKLYEWKLNNPGGKFHKIDFRDIVMYSILELRWPKLTTLARITNDVLKAIGMLTTDAKDEKEILKDFDYIQELEEFFGDELLKHFFKTFYNEKIFKEED